MNRYVELQCKTNYSFLEGASHGHELVQTAAHLGLEGLAITDRNGVYALPKAFAAQKEMPHVRLISGSEIYFSDHPPVTMLAATRAGYGLMCRMITALHAGKPKGDGTLTFSEWQTFLEIPAAQELFYLPALHPDVQWDQIKAFVPEKVYIPVSRFLDGCDSARFQLAHELRKKWELPWVATNQVHYHIPERRRLQDALTCVRHGVPLNQAGFKLQSNGERYLKSPAQMQDLFQDYPEALQATLEIAEQCLFSLKELRYYYPSEWIPQNHTAQSFLEELTWMGARERYPQGAPESIAAQIHHELKLIHELRFADYFLTIWDIIKFARSRHILCQGRGSAANSVVCYCLGITAIDPTKINLLFERFISVERGEPPDIDVDFEHERREEVIQYIYEKYGRDRAAMVAAVITYRSKSIARDLDKVFDFQSKPEAMKEELMSEIADFPRHLSIHSGGFTLSADSIIETVPVEPARMEGRTIIQWDKYDLDIVGLLKVDVLALGMLTAIQKTLQLTGYDNLASIRHDDPATYAMIQKADTIGVFQIESRAQMSMLGRLQPQAFYDLVVQVAIVRPGPITGKMVHPYLRRKWGIDPVVLPHPLLYKIMDHTYGVPIFQEQIMRIAIELADFKPGEADQLRRAIGAWRSNGSIAKMGVRFREGLTKKGLPRAWVNTMFEHMKGFSEYGFPESHAASFALLAYVSSYLKCHHPAEFTCSLINSQPMGFYSVHTLIEDAKRHGVDVLSLCPHVSLWDCQMENGAVRLGWRIVHGMDQSDAERLIAERTRTPFQNLYDFIKRTHLKPQVLYRLAMTDVFRSFQSGGRPMEPRLALWEILTYDVLLKTQSQEQMTLFQEDPYKNSCESSPLVPLSEYEQLRSDFDAFGVSLHGHPMKILRKRVPGLAPFTIEDAKKLGAHQKIMVSGLVIVRQRPPTAKGVTFATLEDETGFMDLVIKPHVYQKYQEEFLSHSFFTVSGLLQKERNTISLLVARIKSFHVDQGGDEETTRPLDETPPSVSSKSYTDRMASSIKRKLVASQDTQPLNFTAVHFSGRAKR